LIILCVERVFPARHRWLAESASPSVILVKFSRL
jgi:hypothetical protein